MSCADLPLSDLLSLSIEISLYGGIAGGALGVFCYGLLLDLSDWFAGRFLPSRGRS